LHDHRPLDRVRADRRLRQVARRVRHLRAADRPGSAEVLRVRRGLHAECSVREPGERGQTARLPGPAGDPEGAAEPRGDRGRGGARPEDASDGGAVGGVPQGARVLHHPGPGLPQEGGRSVLHRAERHPPGLDQPGAGREADAGDRVGLGQGMSVALQARVRAPGRRRRPGGGLTPWLFALPALLVYVIFLVYPALSSLWFSFTDWDGLSPDYTVVGLENYRALAADPVVATALRNNVL